MLTDARNLLRGGAAHHVRNIPILITLVIESGFAHGYMKKKNRQVGAQVASRDGVMDSATCSVAFLTASYPPSISHTAWPTRFTT